MVFIRKKDNNTVVNQVVQTNLEDTYCFELRYSLRADYFIITIDFCHFFDLFANSKNCIL